MKVRDNADSDNKAAATNSTSPKNFLIRVQLLLGRVKLLENGAMSNIRTRIDHELPKT